MVMISEKSNKEIWIVVLGDNLFTQQVIFFRLFQHINHP